MLLIVWQRPPALTLTSNGASLPTVTAKVNCWPTLMPVPAFLQILTLPRFVSLVKVTDFSTPRPTVTSTLPPVRSMVLQPGLQAIETMRYEVEGCSATWTLVPSTMLSIAWQRPPALTSTSNGASL